MTLKFVFNNKKFDGLPSTITNYIIFDLKKIEKVSIDLYIIKIHLGHHVQGEKQFTQALQKEFYGK